jgi:hypothetical protein
MKHTGDYKWDEATTRQAFAPGLSDEQWAELWDEFAGVMDNYGMDLLADLLSDYETDDEEGADE